MNLTQISNTELTLTLDRLVRSERKLTSVILAHINEFDLRMLFAENGFSSMFEYLTKHLGYDEAGAYRRLAAARLLRGLPELSQKVQNGSLNLTQLSQVQTALRQEKRELRQKFGKADFDLNEKATLVLAKIENKTLKQTQGILAKEFNTPILIKTCEKVQGDESVRLEITFSKEQMQILQEVRAMCSHQNPDQAWNDLFVLLAKKEIRRRMGRAAVSAESVPRSQNDQDTQNS